MMMMMMCNNLCWLKYLLYNLCKEKEWYTLEDVYKHRVNIKKVFNLLTEKADKINKFENW